MHFFGILGIILKIKRVYFFYILPKLLPRIIHFKNLIQLYIIFYQSDASLSIKKIFVNIANQSDSLIPDNYYVFKDGIILNTYLMSNSNTNSNYIPFIKVRYDKNNNSYIIRIHSIVYSNSNGDNFSNRGSVGSIIIYYI